MYWILWLNQIKSKLQFFDHNMVVSNFRKVERYSKVSNLLLEYLKIAAF